LQLKSRAAVLTGAFPVFVQDVVSFALVTPWFITK